MYILLSSFIIEDFHIHQPLVSKYQKALKDFHNFSRTSTERNTPTHPSSTQIFGFLSQEKSHQLSDPTFLVRDENRFSELKIDLFTGTVTQPPPCDLYENVLSNLQNIAMPFLKNSFYFNRTDLFFLFIFHQRYIQDIDGIVPLIKVQTGWMDLFMIQFCQSGLWSRSSSVPGLVLVVPSVEIVVEEDDASGGHAGNDAPEGGKPHVSNASCAWSGENFTGLMQKLQPLADEAAVQKSGQIRIQNKYK